MEKTIVTTRKNIVPQMKLLKILINERNRVNGKWQANFNDRTQPKFIIKSRFDYDHTQRLYIRLQNVGVDTFAFPTYEKAIRFRREHRDKLLQLGDLI